MPGRSESRAARIVGLVALMLVPVVLLPAAPKLKMSISNSPPSSANWNVGTLGEANLTAGAGSDLPSSFETVAAFVTMSVTAGSLGSWKMSVRRVDSLWSPVLHLFVRRTADGTGLGSITGGAAYQEVTISDILFFSGSQDRSGIAIQLRLDGVTGTMGPGAYSTQVTYTATEP